MRVSNPHDPVPRYSTKKSALRGDANLCTMSRGFKSIFSGEELLMRIVRLVAFSIALALIAPLSSCGGKSPTEPSACTNGPYTFDSNPNVNRCRASNGQFAANSCCRR